MFVRLLSNARLDVRAHGERHTPSSHPIKRVMRIEASMRCVVKRPRGLFGGARTRCRECREVSGPRPGTSPCAHKHAMDQQSNVGAAVHRRNLHAQLPRVARLQLSSATVAQSQHNEVTKPDLRGLRLCGSQRGLASRGDAGTPRCTDYRPIPIICTAAALMS